MKLVRCLVIVSGLLVPGVQAEDRSPRGAGPTAGVIPFSDDLGLLSTRIHADSFQPESSSSGEGESITLGGVIDGSRNEAAWVHFYFPRSNPRPEGLFASIFEPHGLLESNGWKSVEPRAASKRSFPWVKEQVAFVSAKDGCRGWIFVGELNGRSFRVTAHHPDALEKWFEPRYRTILENLKVRPTAPPPRDSSPRRRAASGSRRSRSRRRRASPSSAS